MIKPAGRETFKHLALGAGALLWGADMADVAAAADMRLVIEKAQSNGTGYLGKTCGNTRFSAVPRYRRFGTDGSAFESGGCIESWDIRLETSLLELTPDILALTLTAGTDDSEDNKTELALGEGLANGNLVWAGDLSDGRLLAIELLNAVSVGGLRLELGEDEGRLLVAFSPRQGSVYNDKALPFNVYYLS